MRHEKVTIDNIYKCARVAPSTSFPKSLLNSLIQRGVYYGILNISKIEKYGKTTLIEASWYDEYNTFIFKFWHNITQGHLLHLSDGHFDIDETLENLDKIANGLMENKIDTYE